MKFNKTTRKDSYIEMLKMEIAEELGLLDKIYSEGWGGLSATESGRIGGKLAAALKKQGLKKNF